MQESKLRKAQEKFFRLRENIVPHLMAAIKNLQYTKGFYPMPDVVSFRLLTLGTVVRWLGGQGFNTSFFDLLSESLLLNLFRCVGILDDAGRD